MNTTPIRTMAAVATLAVLGGAAGAPVAAAR